MTSEGTHLPADYRFRAPTLDDLDAVGDVVAADQREGAEEAVLDTDFVRQVWSRPDFDLVTDAWVVTDGRGAIVAYGQVRREEPDIVGSWGAVHPEHRGRGIGPSLLDRIEARATMLLADVPVPRFRHSVNAADPAAAAMLARRGLHPIRHYWHMQIDLVSSFDPGTPPEGIEIGGIEPGDDLRAVHAVLGDAFADDPGDHPGSYERWIVEETASPSHDPSLWLVAREGEAAVGALAASSGDDGGWVDWLAVVASRRGRGIGVSLLRRAFASFAARGVRRVMVSVDAENATGATAVYERVGMRVVNGWDLWERSSSPR